MGRFDTLVEPSVPSDPLDPSVDLFPGLVEPSVPSDPLDPSVDLFPGLTGEPTPIGAAQGYAASQGWSTAQRMAGSKYAPTEGWIAQYAAYYRGLHNMRSGIAAQTIGDIFEGIKRTNDQIYDARQRGDDVVYVPGMTVQESTLITPSNLRSPGKGRTAQGTGAYHPGTSGGWILDKETGAYKPADTWKGQLEGRITRGEIPQHEKGLGFQIAQSVAQHEDTMMYALKDAPGRQYLGMSQGDDFTEAVLMTPENLKAIRAASHKRMVNFVKILAKNQQLADNMRGFHTEQFEKWMNDPDWDIPFTTLFAEAAPGMVTSFLAQFIGTALTGNPLGGALATGGQSYNLEYGAHILASMWENGYDPRDEGSAAQFFRDMMDDSDMWDRIKEDARAGGLIVGGFDAATAYLAGSILKMPIRGLDKFPKTAVTAKGLGELVMQMGGGGAGEALKQIYLDGEITDPAGVYAEMVIEIASGPVEIALNNYKVSNMAERRSLERQLKGSLQDYKGIIERQIEDGTITEDEGSAELLRMIDEGMANLKPLIQFAVDEKALRDEIQNRTSTEEESLILASMDKKDSDSIGSYIKQRSEALPEDETEAAPEPLEVKDVREAIQIRLDEMTGAPPVFVFNHPDALLQDARATLQAAFEAVRESGTSENVRALSDARDNFKTMTMLADQMKEILALPGGNVEGVNFDGTVYLHAPGISSAERALQVYDHEAIGHVAVERVLGKTKTQNKFYARVAGQLLADPDMKSTVDDIAKHYLSEEDHAAYVERGVSAVSTKGRMEMAKEYVARFSEDPELLSPTALSRLADWGRKHVLRRTPAEKKEKLTDREVIKALQLASDHPRLSLGRSIARQIVSSRQRSRSEGRTDDVRDPAEPWEDLPAATPAADIRQRVARGTFSKQSEAPDAGTSFQTGLKISTRNPTALNRAADPADTELVVGLEATSIDPAMLLNHVIAVHSYPGIKRTGPKPEQMAEDFIEHVSNNLLWLYDQMDPDVRARSAQWYVGGRRIVEEWSQEYGFERAGVAAAIAVLSPRTDWLVNLDLARRLMDILKNKGNEVFDDAMAERYVRLFSVHKKDKRTLTKADRLANEKVEALADAMKGKTLDELKSDFEKAAFIRTYDETYNGRGYQTVSPEGDFLGPALLPSGEPAQTAWQSMAFIAKAVKVLRDPTRRTISEALGEAHKVRNFYNNLLLPETDQISVTIDTHAVAAGLLMPLGAKDDRTGHNFGAKVKGSKVTGISGTYGLYAEAYRRAAAARGIAPREMQSTTWAAAKGLFATEWKTAKNKAAVDKLWKEYENGTRSIDETRNAILELAGGIDRPDWAERPGADTAPGDGIAADEGQLPAAGIREQELQADPGGGAAPARPLSKVRRRHKPKPGPRGKRRPGLGPTYSKQRHQPMTESGRSLLSAGLEYAEGIAAGSHEIYVVRASEFVPDDLRYQVAIQRTSVMSEQMDPKEIEDLYMMQAQEYANKYGGVAIASGSRAKTKADRRLFELADLEPSEIKLFLDQSYFTIESKRNAVAPMTFSRQSNDAVRIKQREQLAVERGGTRDNILDRVIPMLEERGQFKLTREQFEGKEKVRKANADDVLQGRASIEGDEIRVRDGGALGQVPGARFQASWMKMDEFWATYGPVATTEDLHNWIHLHTPKMRRQILDEPSGDYQYYVIIDEDTGEEMPHTISPTEGDSIKELVQEMNVDWTIAHNEEARARHEEEMEQLIIVQASELVQAQENPDAAMTGIPNPFEGMSEEERMNVDIRALARRILRDDGAIFEWDPDDLGMEISDLAPYKVKAVTRAPELPGTMYHRESLSEPGGTDYEETLYFSDHMSTIPGMRDVPVALRGTWLTNHYEATKIVTVGMTAAVRSRTRVTPDGKKAKVLEEAQNDHAKTLRKNGMALLTPSDLISIVQDPPLPDDLTRARVIDAIATAIESKSTEEAMPANLIDQIMEGEPAHDALWKAIAPGTDVWQALANLEDIGVGKDTITVKSASLQLSASELAEWIESDSTLSAIEELAGKMKGFFIVRHHPYHAGPGLASVELWRLKPPEMIPSLPSAVEALAVEAPEPVVGELPLPLELRLKRIKGIGYGYGGMLSLSTETDARLDLYDWAHKQLSPLATKDWVSQVLRMEMRRALDEGYELFGWTPGWMQNRRYRKGAEGDMVVLWTDATDTRRAVGFDWVTEESLAKEYQQWLKANIPDESKHDDAMAVLSLPEVQQSPRRKRWLNDFIGRWDRLEAGQIANRFTISPYLDDDGNQTDNYGIVFDDRTGASDWYMDSADLTKEEAKKYADALNRVYWKETWENVPKTVQEGYGYGWTRENVLVWIDQNWQPGMSMPGKKIDGYWKVNWKSQGNYIGLTKPEFDALPFNTPDNPDNDDLMLLTGAQATSAESDAFGVDLDGSGPFDQAGHYVVLMTDGYGKGKRVKIGGEPLKEFYDKEMVQKGQKIAKTKIELMDFGDGFIGPGVDLTDPAVMEALMGDDPADSPGNGVPLYSKQIEGEGNSGDRGALDKLVLEHLGFQDNIIDGVLPLLPEKFQPQQLLAKLEKVKGGKAYAEWIRLDEWALEMGKTSKHLTREEVEEYVLKHTPRFTVHLLDQYGDPPFNWTAGQPWVDYRYDPFIDEFGGALPQEERFKILEEMGIDPPDRGVPGAHQGLDYMSLYGDDSTYDVTEPYGSNYKEILVEIELPRASEKDPLVADWADDYSDGHWPDFINVMVSIRVTEREIHGNRVLFIEEIQSDWHQASRKSRQTAVRDLMRDKLDAFQLEEDVPFAAIWERFRKEAEEEIPVDFGYNKAAEIFGGSITVDRETADALIAKLGKEGLDHITYDEDALNYEEYQEEHDDEAGPRMVTRVTFTFDNNPVTPESAHELSKLTVPQWTELKQWLENREEARQREIIKADPGGEARRAGAVEADDFHADVEIEGVEEEQGIGANTIPDAPFKKDWHALAMKIVMHMGKAGGFDQVAWLDGDGQNRRYNKGRRYEGLHYEKLQPKKGSGVSLQQSGLNRLFRRQGAAGIQEPVYLITATPLLDFPADFDSDDTRIPVTAGTYYKESELKEHFGEKVANAIVAGEGEKIEAPKELKAGLTRLRKDQKKKQKKHKKLFKKGESRRILASDLGMEHIQLGGHENNAFYDRDLRNRTNAMLKDSGQKVGHDVMSLEQAAEDLGLKDRGMEFDRRGRAGDRGYHYFKVDENFNPPDFLFSKQGGAPDGGRHTGNMKASKKVSAENADAAPREVTPEAARLSMEEKADQGLLGPTDVPWEEGESLDVKWSKTVNPANSEMDPVNGQGKFAIRVLEDDRIPQEVKDQVQVEYEVQTNQATLDAALEIFHGEDPETRFSTGIGLTHPVRAMLGQILVLRASANVRLAQALGQLDAANVRADKAAALANELSELGRSYGQAIQIFSAFSLLDPHSLQRLAKRQVGKAIGVKLRRKGATETTEEVNAAVKGAQTNAAGGAASTAESRRAAAKAIRRKRKEERSLWGRYRSEVVKLILEHVRRGYAGVSASQKTALEAFTERLVKHAKNKLREAGLPEAERRATEAASNLEILKDMLENSDKYLQTWEEVGQAILEEHKDDPAKLRTITDVYGSITFDEASGRVLVGVVKEELATMEESLDALVREHYSLQNATRDKLRDRIIARLGLEPAAAGELAKSLEQSYRRLLKEEVNRQLEGILSRAKPKVKRAVKTQAQKIIEMANLGAFDREDVYNAVARGLGLPEAWDPAWLKKMNALSDKVQKAAPGSPKENAMVDMMNEIANKVGDNPVDVMFSIRYANLLSGFRTHEINIASNLEMLLIGFATQLLRSYGSPTTLGRLFTGLARGFGIGTQEAMNVMMTGRGRKGVEASKFRADNVLERTTFKNVLYPLNILKYLSTRPLAAMDALFRFTNLEMKSEFLAVQLAKGQGLKGAELKARVKEILQLTESDVKEAHNQAAAEGLDGKALKRRVAELMQMARDPELNEDAVNFALTHVYQNVPDGLIGVVAKALIGVVHPTLQAGEKMGITRWAAQKVGQVLVPFIQTVANVANIAIEMTPVLGTMRWAGFKVFPATEAGIAQRPIKTTEQLNDMLARNVLGTLAFAILQALILAYEDEDEEDQLFAISGPGPSDWQDRKTLMDTTKWRPWAIKLFGVWFNYGESPFAIPGAILGGYHDQRKYGDMDEQELSTRLAAAVMAGGQVLFDQTFLTGVADFMDIARFDATSLRKAERLFFSTTGSFAMPTLARQIVDLFDPTKYGVNDLNGAWIRVIPYGSLGGGYPDLNVWGEPVTKMEGSISERFIDRIVRAAEQEDEVMDFLVRNKMIPRPTSKNYQILAKENPTDSEQAQAHYLFSRYFGQEFKQRIQGDMERLVEWEEHGFSEQSLEAAHRADLIRDRLELRRKQARITAKNRVLKLERIPGGIKREVDNIRAAHHKTKGIRAVSREQAEPAMQEEMRRMQPPPPPTPPRSLYRSGNP